MTPAGRETQGGFIMRPITQVVWFGGREFRHVTWRGIPNVTVTWAVWEHVTPAIMRARFMGRREH